jgi:uncharacterized protein YndB with AHSA1/START domain
MTGLPAQPRPVRWRLHLATPPEAVYRFLASDEGRAAFWAEAAPQHDGVIEFAFSNGWRTRSRLIEAVPGRRFALEYLGSPTRFELAPDGRGGTDLTLLAENVPEADWHEVHAGWVSVLLALKAAADFGVDLRNHDPERSWDQGFVDN